MQIDVSSIGTAGITIVAFMVLNLAILTSRIDRRFSAQARDLESSEQRYRQLVESAQVILWRRNIQTSQFSYVNQEAKVLLGYPVGQWMAERTFWPDHIHSEDRALVASFCAKAIEEKLPQEFEHRMMNADGTILWLKSSVRLVAGPGGQHELGGIMVDITRLAASAASCASLRSALGRLRLFSPSPRMYQ